MMIDIHTHILPYVDDGAKDIASSLQMIQESVHNGVTDLFLTPHFMKIRNYLSVAPENRKIFLELQKEVINQGIKINLHLGNEVYYTIDSLNDLRNKQVIPLGNSKMVLIEFSLSDEHEDIAEAIHNITALGFTPIIAHVERYPYLKEKDYLIVKKMGAMIQINASSVIGKSGHDMQKIAIKLIRGKYADFVASDIHLSRYNYMQEAYVFVSKKFGSLTAEKLFNNTSILT